MTERRAHELSRTSGGSSWSSRRTTRRRTSSRSLARLRGRGAGGATSWSSTTAARTAPARSPTSWPPRDPRRARAAPHRKAGLGAAYVAGFGWALDDGLRRRRGDGRRRLARARGAAPAAGRAARRRPGARLPLGARRRGAQLAVHRLLLSRGGNLYTRLAAAAARPGRHRRLPGVPAAVLERLTLDDVASPGLLLPGRPGLAGRRGPGSGWSRCRSRSPSASVGRSKMSGAIVSEALWRVTVWGSRPREPVAPGPKAADRRPEAERVPILLGVVLLLVVEIAGGGPSSSSWIGFGWTLLAALGHQRCSAAALLRREGIRALGGRSAPRSPSGRPPGRERAGRRCWSLLGGLLMRAARLRQRPARAALPAAAAPAGCSAGRLVGWRADPRCAATVVRVRSARGPAGGPPTAPPGTAEPGAGRVIEGEIVPPRDERPPRRGRDPGDAERPRSRSTGAVRSTAAVSWRAVRRPRSTSRRSASTSSRSAMERRSSSMSQWVRGGLTFFGSGSAPPTSSGADPSNLHSQCQRDLGVVGERHARTGGPSGTGTRRACRGAELGVPLGLVAHVPRAGCRAVCARPWQSVLGVDVGQDSTVRPIGDVPIGCQEVTEINDGNRRKDSRRIGGPSSHGARSTHSAADPPRTGDPQVRGAPAAPDRHRRAQLARGRSAAAESPGSGRPAEHLVAHLRPAPPGRCRRPDAVPPGAHHRPSTTRALSSPGSPHQHSTSTCSAGTSSATSSSRWVPGNSRARKSVVSPNA